MAGTWEKKSADTADPMKDYIGKPVISKGSSKARFLGRVVVELWEEPGSTDEQMIALAVDSEAVKADPDKFLKRVVNALSSRVAKL